MMERNGGTERDEEAGCWWELFLREGTKKESIVRGSCTVHGYPTGMGRFIVFYIFIPDAS